MPETVISNTSCFILLTNIGEIDLLRKVYGKILTTAEVSNEFGQTLPDWVEIKTANDKYIQRILEIQVDKGEASVLALSLEHPESLIILDDSKARKMADHLGIKVTGTLGVIIKAKHKGIIISIKPYLRKIRKTEFHITEELEEIALKEAGE